MTSRSIPVFGMTCGRCEAKVASAIEALGNGITARADREFNRVTIAGPADEGLIRKTILSLGYQLEETNSSKRSSDAQGSAVHLGPTQDGAEVLASSAAVLPSLGEETTQQRRTQEVFLDIEGMSCAACVAAVTAAINRAPGVEHCEVNFAAESAWVLGRIDVQAIIHQVQDAGYEAIETPDDGSLKRDQQQARFKVALAQASVALVTATGLMINMWFGWFALGVDLKVDLGLSLMTLVIMLASGRTFYRKAWVSLRYGRTTMDTLVAMSTATAWFYSSWALLSDAGDASKQLFFEAALFVIGFVRLGKALEMRARANALSGLDELIRLAPAEVTLLDASGNSRTVALSEVTAGQTVRVLPGARIPLDGRVVKGETEVDTALVTGESLPVLVKADEPVQGGCLNLSHPIDLLVTHSAKEGSLAQMVRALKRAQNAKPAVAEQIDLITQYFVPTIVLISLLTAFMWWAVIGATPHFALSAALCVLIIACPCGLGLAVPMSLVNAIGVAASRGLILRNGNALLTSRQLTHLLLDKTGTLTEGRLWVSRANTSGDVEQSNALLALATHSEHPIAKAVVAYLQSKNAGETGAVGDFVNGLDVRDVLSAPGRGLTGIINDQQVAMGSLSYLGELGFDVDSGGAIASTVNHAETATHVGPVTWWGIAGQVVGYFQLGDQIRLEALGVVQQLKSTGVQPVMLSGDRPDAVEYLADCLDQMPWHAQQSPQQKLSIVEALKAQGFVVGMVGDGMNDGPALAAAHVSFAMSEGTVLASEQADVTLAAGLQGIVGLVRLSSAVHRNIRQNLFFAFAYNLALIPIASGLLFPLTGWLLSPSFAGLAMALSSVSVVLNAARLNRSAVTA